MKTNKKQYVSIRTNRQDAINIAYDIKKYNGLYAGMVYSPDEVNVILPGADDIIKAYAENHKLAVEIVELDEHQLVDTLAS